MMTMMNGNNNTEVKCNCGSFKKLYERQLENQQLLLEKGMYDCYALNLFSLDKLPQDDISLFSYHIQQLQSEIGELLQSDKRWKNFRKDVPNIENKKEEIADCFIVLMNIAIFSGLSSKDLYSTIEQKIKEVKERIEKE